MYACGRRFPSSNNPEQLSVRRRSRTSRLCSRSTCTEVFRGGTVFCMLCHHRLGRGEWQRHATTFFGAMVLALSNIAGCSLVLDSKETQCVVNADCVST